MGKIETMKTQSIPRWRSSIRCLSFEVLLTTALSLATVTAGFGQPILQFSASTYSVPESQGAATLGVQRLGDLSAAVSVDYATTDGTATDGVKYTATNGTLAFATGITNQWIVVPLLNDGFVEGTRNFRVTLSNPTGGAVLGSRTNATVSITDNDLGVSFRFTNYFVVEGAGAVLIDIVRGDDGNLPVTVDLTTSDSTALSGRDYTGATTNLMFAPNERLKTVAIPILNNGLRESNRSFRVTLSNAVGASLGQSKTTTITIVDDDQGFQFESANYTVGEDAGAALVRVLRGTDDTSGTITVECATADGTATHGLDYIGVTNTLTLGPGDKVKMVPIPILNDGVADGSKAFLVRLSNPTGGAVLGPCATTTVSIQDNDPGLGFELSRHSIWQGASEIKLTVLRGNDGALGPVAVAYATADGTARAGQDYQATSGTLQFEANEIVQSLTIALLPAALRTGDFQVSLSHPTGGATLGRATTTVTIQKNYCTVAPPFDSKLAIRRDHGVSVVTWTGDGQVQRADRVTGPWQTLAAPRSPWNVQPPIPASFYRVTSFRPVNLYIPSAYDGTTPLPLVIALHGYSVNGKGIEDYLQLQRQAESRGFLYCHPEGTRDQWGQPFWNATDAVGDFGNTGVDDAGYLRALIEQIAQRFAVDRERIFLIGHSNGGFMAYRMACQSAELIAGIASFAGMTFLDPSRCQPVQPVNILHICGTADELMYSGGADAIGMFGGLIRANTPQFPGALQTIQLWAGYNGASGPVTDPVPTLDLTRDRPGLDTVVTRYTNAPPGGAVELWTIKDGTHIPALSSQFSPQVVDWLFAHPKP